MKERRDVERRRVLLGGLLETAAFLPEIACTIRNVSLTGARIRIAEGSILPERVILRVPIRGECREARIVWRDGDAVGLHFEAIEAVPTLSQRKTVDGEPEKASLTPPKGSLH
ncbi:PilZ domain-containing protein [Methylobacterium sp. NFXW15]|uniref:PilZ domain-containing protein n=1 Tax=Methylobacterium sp. NFXW15 TaxID=2819512 RepID=UPI003CF0A46C